MSCDVMGKKSVACPCGKGLITRTGYMDDWNESDESYAIECPDCRKKYRLVSYPKCGHHCQSSKVYSLLDVDYPDYDGTRLEDVFPICVNVNAMPFHEFLIRTYTCSDLHDALSELNDVTAVSRLSGIAYDIAKTHKRYFNSAKISVLREYVGKACKKYHEISDNKECRLPIEQKENDERTAYEAERRKHMIPIHL